MPLRPQPGEIGYGDEYLNETADQHAAEDNDPTTTADPRDPFYGSSAYEKGGAFQRLLMRMGEGSPSVDDLTPDYQMEKSLGDIASDAEGMGAERDALAALQDVYRSGGMTSADRAQMAMRQRQVAQAERAQREAVRSQYAQRGLLGSGMEYASSQDAAQAGASAFADMEAEAQAAASARALQAMQAAGGLGSTMRQEGDAISRFNAGYLRDVNERNVNRQNRQSDARAGAEQQRYQNRMGAVQSAAGGGRGSGGGTSDLQAAAGGAASGAAAGAAFGPYGALIGGVGGGVLGALGNDEDEEGGW